jgi:hypothetical protein
MSDIPEWSNFFSSLSTNFDRRRVAEQFRLLGWEVRKCGWAAYEMRCSFAELVVEGGSPILMHGAVADVVVNLDRILSPLREAGICYSGECYDGGGKLLGEYNSGTDASNLPPT